MALLGKVMNIQTSVNMSKMSKIFCVNNNNNNAIKIAHLAELGVLFCPVLAFNLNDYLEGLGCCLTNIANNDQRRTPLLSRHETGTVRMPFCASLDFVQNCRSACEYASSFQL